MVCLRFPYRIALALIVFESVFMTGCTPERRGMKPSAELPFPTGINGWVSSPELLTYGRDNIFDYMNGAGELYKAYDFKRLFVKHYFRPDAPDIVAEVYKMATSQDAYGVFTYDPEGETVAVGQDSTYAAGLLRFWKGRCFVRILADRDTPEAKAAVVALGQSLAAPIVEGPRPALLKCLPPQDIEPLSIRYFHTQISLNYFYYLADDNLLHLSPETEAVMAVYRPQGRKMKLFILRYPDAEKAEKAYQQFGGGYFESAGMLDTVYMAPIEDGSHAGILIKDRFIAAVFDAPSRSACEMLLKKTDFRFDNQTLQFHRP